MELTSKQKMALRALAHHLDPVVQVGNAGVTDAVLAKVQFELENHELIKVKVAKESPIAPADAAAAIAGPVGAGLAQIIGRTLVLYRPRKKKPTIKLPAAGA
jgi:RNA-binding protein